MIVEYCNNYREAFECVSIRNVVHTLFAAHGFRHEKRAGS